LLPEVKLIFLLRDPVERAYSHYYHALQTGRAIYSFEEAIQYGRRFYIARGLYREQIERYLEVFDREQITVLLFEDFIQNMQKHVDTLCDWLNLSGRLDLSGLDTTQENAALVPRWPKLIEWQNYLFRSLSDGSANHGIALLPENEPSSVDKFLNRVDHRLRYFNLREVEKPPMSSKVRDFLERLYAKENRGLPELIGTDVGRQWPYMKNEYR